MELNQKEDQKDDELTIDFGKLFSRIKKVLRADKESHEQATAHHDVHETSDPSSAVSRQKDDEFSIDVKGAVEWAKKNYLVFLLLIPLCLSFWIGLSPINFPIADQWATNSVQNAYRQQIAAQINQQYPNLPPENRNTLIDRQMGQILKEQKATYDSQVEQVGQQFRSHWQDENSYTYMPDIDTYYYLRYARNIVENGSYGDTTKDDEQWDMHMLAPDGYLIKPGMHPYVMAYLYKIMHPFNSKITLMQAAGYYPIIFLLMALVAAFFIGYRLSGEVGGFVAAMILLINPTVIGKTIFGHSDTDAYQIFFPLAIIWALVEAYRTDDTKKKVGLSVLTGFLMGLYSFAWEGWWYLFDFLGAAIVITIIIIIAIDITKKKHHKDILKNPYVRNIGLIALVGFAVTGVVVSVVHGPVRFITAPLEPISFSTIQSAILEDIWPNVYTTVAELNTANTDQIIWAVGGKALFAFSLLGMLGMLYVAFKKEQGRDHRQYLLYFILLLIWYGGVFYAAQKGVRFILLIVPPFSIAFGVGAGLIWQKIHDALSKHLHVSKKITLALLIIVLAVFFWPKVQTARAIASSDVPMINDAWVAAMENIKQDSEPDAIINSWWDFGHHFKYLADRAVTFDGASQNRPQAHWIGHVLLTGDERDAVGILRMLDCGGNQAADMLTDSVQDTKRAVDITYRLIHVDRAEAKAILDEEGIDVDMQERILEKTHCDPPDNYFIASEDMIGKAGVWSHFGGWDFEKAFIWMQLRDRPKDDAVRDMTNRFGYTQEKAEDIYLQVQTITDEREGNTWISPWPGYLSTGGACRVDESEAVIKCTNNVQGRVLEFVIEPRTMNVTIANSVEKSHPKRFVFSNASGFQVKEFEKNTVGFSLGLVNQDGNFESIVMSNELAPSMFTRMFFYGGAGLRYFDPFDYQRSFGGLRIYTYKVDWDGTDPIPAIMADGGAQDAENAGQEGRA